MSRPVVTPMKPTARERLADYIADQEAAAENNRRREMTKRKTAQKDKVDKFPDVGDRGRRIAEVREALADAFERAERFAGVEARMQSVKTANPAGGERFPVLKGGEHG